MLAGVQRSMFDKLGGTVAGAILGTVARYWTLYIWPQQVPNLVSTLLVVGIGCLVLGLLWTREIRADVSSVLVGAVGAASSVSALALFAITSSPLVCLGYVVAVPAVAVVSLCAGVAMGLRRGRVVNAVVADS